MRMASRISWWRKVRPARCWCCSITLRCLSRTLSIDDERLDWFLAKPMSHGRRSLFPSMILALLAIPALHAQALSPIPGYLQDIAGQFAMPDEFSFEQQIQAGTQGNPSNGNPFGYWHGVQIRPWFHYDG